MVLDKNISQDNGLLEVGSDSRDASQSRGFV